MAQGQDQVSRSARPERSSTDNRGTAGEGGAAVTEFAANPTSWRTDISSVYNRIGVYSIRNLVNGKRYVGSALNVRSRWRQHLKYLLEDTGSGQRKLRTAWDKYGASAFIFEVLEQVAEPKTLLRTEQHYIDQYNSVACGYNVRLLAESNLGIVFGPRSEESRRKLSESAKARGVRPASRLGVKHRHSARQQMSTTKRAIARKITFNGKSMCVSDWADEIGITVRGLGNRLRRGWPLARALSEGSRGY